MRNLLLKLDRWFVFIVHMINPKTRNYIMSEVLYRNAVRLHKNAREMLASAVEKEADPELISQLEGYVKRSGELLKDAYNNRIEHEQDY